MRLLTYSEAETERLGEIVGSALFPGAFLALFGGLGAGKTAFARGVGKGLGIEGVSSPTFTIVQTHTGEHTLYHFDVYRLSSSDELYDIGFLEYTDGIVLMEWAQNVKDALQKSRMDISISGFGDEPREFFFYAQDERHKAILKAIGKETAL